MHMSHEAKCPFCLFRWSCVDRIMAHFAKVHRNRLSTNFFLPGICALRGRAMVNFLDTYEYHRLTCSPHPFSLKYPENANYVERIHVNLCYCTSALRISNWLGDRLCSTDLQCPYAPCLV